MPQLDIDPHVRPEFVVDRDVRLSVDAGLDARLRGTPAIDGVVAAATGHGQGEHGENQGEARHVGAVP